MSHFRALLRKNQQMLLNPREEERKRLVINWFAIDYKKKLINKRCWLFLILIFRVRLTRRMKRRMHQLVLLALQVGCVSCDAGAHNGVYGALTTLTLYRLSVIRWRASQAKRQEAQKWEAAFASAAGTARLWKWNVTTWTWVNWMQNCHISLTHVFCAK